MKYRAISDMDIRFYLNLQMRRGITGVNKGMDREIDLSSMVFQCEFMKALMKEILATS